MASTSRTADKNQRHLCSKLEYDADDFLDLTDTSLESADIDLSQYCSDQSTDQNKTADFADSGLGSEKLFVPESASQQPSHSENHNGSNKLGLTKAPKENYKKKPSSSLDFMSHEPDLDVNDCFDESFVADDGQDEGVDPDQILLVLDDVADDVERAPETLRFHPYNSKKGKQPLKGKARFKYTPRREMEPVPQQMPREEPVLEELITEEDEELTFPVAQPKAAAPPLRQECQGCDNLYSPLSLIECCESHVVCNECATKKTKEVLTGEKKGSVGCPKKDCNSSLPISELRKVHPVMVIELLEDKWNKETMEALEQMSDVVKCPECSLALVVDVDVKRFKCAQCSHSFCRHCMKKWQWNEHDLCISVKPWTSSYSGKIINIPAFWEDPTPNQVYSLIELSMSSIECVDIMQHVQKFMKCDVKKIYRIQNHKIWEKYSVTRSHMIEELGMRLTHESRLFHGTDVNAIEAICNEGFDLRVSGKNATAFGNGIYFARSAAYSHRYAKKGRHNVAGFSLATTFNPAVQQVGSNTGPRVISLHPPISSAIPTSFAIQPGLASANLGGILMQYGIRPSNHGAGFGHLRTTTSNQGGNSTHQVISASNQRGLNLNQGMAPTNQVGNTTIATTPHDPFRSTALGNGSMQSGVKYSSALAAADTAARAAKALVQSQRLQQTRHQIAASRRVSAEPSTGTAANGSQKSGPWQPHINSLSFRPPARPGNSTATGNMPTSTVTQSQAGVQNSGSLGSQMNSGASQSVGPPSNESFHRNKDFSSVNDLTTRIDASNKEVQLKLKAIMTSVSGQDSVSSNSQKGSQITAQATPIYRYKKPSSYKIPLRHGDVEKRSDGTFTFTLKPGLKLTDPQLCVCHKIPKQVCEHVRKLLMTWKDVKQKIHTYSSTKREMVVKYFSSVIFFVKDSFQQNNSTTSSVNQNPSVTRASTASFSTGDSKNKISWTISTNGSIKTNNPVFGSVQSSGSSQSLGTIVSTKNQGLNTQAAMWIPSGSLLQSTSTGLLFGTQSRPTPSDANPGAPATGHSQHSARIDIDSKGFCKCHRLPLTFCKIKKLAKIREELRSKQNANPAIAGKAPSTSLTILTPHTEVNRLNTSVNTIHFQGSNPGGITKLATSNVSSSTRHQSTEEPEAMEIDDESHKTLFDVAAAEASNDCFMVVARVLVGRVCQGSRDMRRPAKNANGDATHTAVDNLSSPQIFVVFDNTQCYPEYLVRYSGSI